MVCSDNDPPAQTSVSTPCSNPIVAYNNIEDESDLGELANRNIFSSDERIPMNSRDYPWSAIGLVVANGQSEPEKGQRCTGTLISDSLVLTSGHCVMDKSTGKVFDPEQVQFYPNYQKKKRYQVFSSAQEIWYNYELKDDSVWDDWAIISLSSPLGKKYGYLGIADIDNPDFSLVGKGYNLPGYSYDYDEGLTATIDTCAIRYVIENKVLHDCASFYGSSGGPLIKYQDQQIMIFAINNAGMFQADGQSFQEDSNFSTKHRELSLAVKVGHLKKVIRQIEQARKQYASIHVCNKSGEDVLIAESFYKGESDGWVSKGWYELEKGKCLELVADENYEGSAYFHAHGKSGVWGDADNQFCVSNKAFDFKSAQNQNCSGDDLHYRGFFEKKISPTTFKRVNLVD